MSVDHAAAESRAEIPGLLPQRACRNCVQIKVRCIPLDDASNKTCQRCSRLQKTCTTTAPSTRKRRRGPSSKVAQLEDRINRLSTLLSPNDTTSGSGTTNASISTKSDDATRGGQQNDIRPDKAVNLMTTATQATHLGSSPGRVFVGDYGTSPRTRHEYATPTPSPENQRVLFLDNSTVQPFPSTGLGSRATAILGAPHEHPSRAAVMRVNFCPIFIDPHLENKLLDTFRVHMNRFFPFVILDPCITAAKMKCEQPFLFWACIASASFTLQEMHKRLNEELLRGFSEYMLIRGVKSLDILQGLLVMAGWTHYYCHLNPQWMNLIHLARAHLVDLGLTQASEDSTRSKLHLELSELVHGRRVNSRLGTNHERRALLGCYFASSKADLYFSHPESMQYSQYMQICCQEMDETTELKSDAHLIQLVRLQHITAKYLGDRSGSPKLPLKAYSSMFNNELSRYLDSLPETLRSDPHFDLDVRIAKVCIFGVFCGMDDEDALAKLEVAHACQEAIEGYFSILFRISPVEISYAPITTLLGLLHCLAMLAQLSFLVLDGWDVQVVRTKLNFVSISQSIGEMFVVMQEYHKVEASVYPPRFALYAGLMRRCKQWFEAKILQEQEPSQGAAEMADCVPDIIPNNLFDGTFDAAFWDTAMSDWSSWMAES